MAAQNADSAWLRSLRRDASPRRAPPTDDAVWRQRTIVRDVVEATRRAELVRISALERDVRSIGKDIGRLYEYGQHYGEYLQQAERSRVDALESGVRAIAQQIGALHDVAGSCQAQLEEKTTAAYEAQMSQHALTRHAQEAYLASHDALAAATEVARLTQEAEMAHEREQAKMLQLAHEATTRLEEVEVAHARQELSLAHEREQVELAHAMASEAQRRLSEARRASLAMYPPTPLSHQPTLVTMEQPTPQRLEPTEPLPGIAMPTPAPSACSPLPDAPPATPPAGPVSAARVKKLKDSLAAVLPRMCDLFKTMDIDGNGTLERHEV